MINIFDKNNYLIILLSKIYAEKYWGLGIGDWGLGIGDWAQFPIANSQSPIPQFLFSLLDSINNYNLFFYLLIK